MPVGRVGGRAALQAGSMAQGKWWAGARQPKWTTRTREIRLPKGATLVSVNLSIGGLDSRLQTNAGAIVGTDRVVTVSQEVTFYGEGGQKPLLAVAAAGLALNATVKIVCSLAGKTS